MHSAIMLLAVGGSMRSLGGSIIWRAAAQFGRAAAQYQQRLSCATTPNAAKDGVLVVRSFFPLHDVSRCLACRACSSGSAKSAGIEEHVRGAGGEVPAPARRARGESRKRRSICSQLYAFTCRCASARCLGRRRRCCMGIACRLAASPLRSASFSLLHTGPLIAMEQPTP